MRVMFKDLDGQVYVTEAVELSNTEPNKLTMMSYGTDAVGDEVDSKNVRIIATDFHVPGNEALNAIGHALVYGYVDITNYSMCDYIETSEDETSELTSAATALFNGGLE